MWTIIFFHSFSFCSLLYFSWNQHFCLLGICEQKRCLFRTKQQIIGFRKKKSKRKRENLTIFCRPGVLKRSRHIWKQTSERMARGMRMIALCNKYAVTYPLPLALVRYVVIICVVFWECHVWVWAGHELVWSGLMTSLVS